MCVGPDYVIVTSWNKEWCAVAQVVSHWLLTAGAWVQFQGIHYAIYGGQSGTEVVFYPSKCLFFPANFHLQMVHTLFLLCGTGTVGPVVVWM